MRRAALSLLLFALGACEPVVPEGRFACDTDDDCPEEMVCRPSRGRCYSTRADAGSREDAGRASDAGPSIDSGRPDAGTDASAAIDAGLDASAAPDAGAPDASAALDAALDATVDASTGVP